MRSQQENVFLYQIVARDEFWPYHYEPEFKRQSMQLMHQSLDRKRNGDRILLLRGCVSLGDYSTVS